MIFKNNSVYAFDRVAVLLGFSGKLTIDATRL